MCLLMAAAVFNNSLISTLFKRIGQQASTSVCSIHSCLILCQVKFSFFPQRSLLQMSFFFILNELLYCYFILYCYRFVQKSPWRAQDECVWSFVLLWSNTEPLSKEFHCGPHAQWKISRVQERLDQTENKILMLLIVYYGMAGGEGRGGRTQHNT